MGTIRQPLLVHHVISAGDLKGTHVRNFGGEDLGKVDDLAVDIQSGRILYVILSLGGFLGMGEKLYAVPWELFSTRPEQPELFVDIDRGMLEECPSFESGKWPDMDNPRWAETIRSQFTQKPYTPGDFTAAGDYAGDDRLDKPDRDRI